MPTLTSDARRRRLADRHLLARPAASAEAVAEALVALHATDPASVFLSVAARAPVAIADVERALYHDRTLVKLLVMRRTVFALPLETAAVAHAACTGAVEARERALLLKHLRESGGRTGDVEAWLSGVEDETEAALLALGEATGGELADRVEGLRVEVDPVPHKPYGGSSRITTRVLGLLAANARIARGRPTGSITSSRYKWAPLRAWLPDGIRPLPAADARRELIRRYLDRFGPATLADVQWWTGLGKTQVRAALKELAAAEVTLDEGVGYVLPGDVDAPPVPATAALLPGLDPTPMGWQERGWYLGPHTGALFDRTGNVGPTVWWDARVVGGWAHLPSGEVAVRLLEPVPAEGRAAIDAEAARLQAWLGDVRITPRFRTPTEQALLS